MGMRVIWIPVLSLLFCPFWGCSRASVTEILFRGNGEEILTAKLPEGLPNVTESGYLPLASGTKDALFYAYYTAEKHLKSSSGASGPPILVWLQGGPGCSSQLGNFYTLGPYKVNTSLMLEPNPGRWNRKYDLLFIDQPVGTGFSIAGERGIPTEELEVAADIYIGLQGFFGMHKDLRDRPLFITGESYGGKYVPAIGHFVIEMEEAHGHSRARQQALLHRRQLPKRATDLGPPLFKLAGLAIGNGLTDPATQVMEHADTAFYMGMIDMSQRVQISVMQLRTAQLIADGAWKEAHAQREELMGCIIRWSGAGTLEDYRRFRDYDADKTVDRYLNKPAVKSVLGVPEDLVFVSCSEKVGDALGPDVMKSVKPLVPDILRAVPLLLYQGQMDAQDGVASNEPWIYGLEWHGKDGFQAAERELWRMHKADVAGVDEAAATACNADQSQPQVPARQTGTVQRSLRHDDSMAVRSNSSAAGADRTSGSASVHSVEGSDCLAAQGKEKVVVGYWKEHSMLTHVVIRNAGHMAPHDQPKVAQAMIEGWVDGVLKQ